MKIKTILIIASLVIAFTNSCSEQNKEEVSEKMEMQKDKAMSDHSIDKATSELVREGVIDLKAIDANADGKIYECPMDWNVLDDKAGDCPVCGMNLKEYSLEDTKANLDKYGYEYKK